MSTLPQLLATAVESNPDGIALRAGHTALSYAELDERSTRLARALIGRGLGPGDRVVLALPRSVDSVVAVWAVIKTGAAFVPIDPGYPAERVAYMLADSRARFGLTQAGIRAGLGDALEWLELDTQDCLEELEHHSCEHVLSADRTRRLYAEDIAYVIYTSGSTGAPKGVAVTHAGLAGLCREQTRRFAVTPASRTLHFASPSFDLAVLELLLAVGAAATMVVVPAGIYGGEELTDILRTQRVTHAIITPAALAGLDATGLPDLNTVVSAGEDCPPSVVAKWSPGRSFCNLYGPTETTIAATISPALRPGEAVTIGGPIPGLSAVVLDARLRPVPNTVVGELYLAGPGLARGYHDRPSLTAARFVAHPDPEGNGDRLYRTGDLVRWITGSDGAPALQFLGRSDTQVQIRGFRVELGEIDEVLTAHESVSYATTLVRTLAGGVDAPVSYVLPAPDMKVDPDALIDHARQHLPRHAVPAAVTVIDRVPLTPVGKLDRAALPEPAFRTRPYRPPVTATERALAALFADLFGVDRVGGDDDFFELGGNSLLATRLAGRLGAQRGVRIPARLVFEYPTVTGLAAAVDGLTGGDLVPLVARPDRGDRSPLSQAQQRMWILARLDPDSAAYNIPLALRLSGVLDGSALTAALHDLVGRHEVLRTRYPEFEGSGHQLTLPATAVAVDLTPVETTATELRAELIALAGKGFDVTTDVPLRARLLRVAEDEHVLMVVLHHLAADGSSLPPLTRDLMIAYRARALGVPPEWTALPVQYADFALWQRDMLGAANDPASLLSTQLSYWRDTLTGLPPLLALPTDRPRPLVATNHGAARHFRLDADTHRGLEELARARGASLFMTVHAALAVLLARLAGADDIAIGAPIAGRGEPELDDVVGMFVNTLVLRTRITGAESFADLLDRVRDTDLAAFAHADAPFESLVAELDPPRSRAHHPLFQVALSFHDFGTRTLSLPGLTVEALDLGEAASPLDLQLTVVPSLESESAAGLDFSWRYATDLFDESTIDMLGQRLSLLLRAAVADPRRAVGDLPLSEPAELAPAAGVELAVPRRLLFDGLLAAAQRDPDAVAVLTDGSSLTYGELTRRANRLARNLIDLGVGPGSTVALALRPSPELVTGLYAIVLAGGAYVPLDPQQPAERLAELLGTVDPVCVLSTSRDGVDAGGRLVLHLDELTNSTELSGFSDMPVTDADRRRPLHDQDLAYVIFTSGSTGRPKAVGIPHAAIANHLAFLTAEYRLTAADTYLQLIQPTFDASLICYTAPFAVGARLVIPDAERRADPDRLAEVLIRHRVTAFTAVPALLRMFAEELSAEALSSVRTVWVGGEPLPADTITRFAAVCPARLHNLYGPTETTVSITGIDVTGLDGPPVPIGHPHANCRIQILDERLHPVPPGTPGELYLSGPQLARGYLGQPGRTAERFVADPSGPAGARRYRTGDLVRQSRTGLEYLGRTDRQLSLRGLRIEPGEVQAALCAHPAVADAAVAIRDGRLLGYLRPVGDSPIDLDDVLRTVRNALPGYMVPAQLVRIETFPRGPTGKLDHAALPEVDPPRHEYRAPATADEQAVGECFGAELGLDRVGRDDDFFELGGNSLSAIRVRAALGARLDLPVPLRHLFAHSRVRELATVLRGETSTATAEYDLLADAMWDPGIGVTDRAPRRPGPPAEILLTGATGFLGAFLLRELLEQTSAAIHCLVRARDESAAHDRILDTAARFGIDLTTHTGRIVAIPGDLAAPRLGLTLERFADLAARIDEIHHNGALVNHLEPYARLRAANVLGTTEILRLAATTRTKAVHYVSTAAAPEDPETVAVLPGYIQTKWVAEQQVRAATERGIPAVVYRPALITGDSRTGAAGTDDAWWTMLRAMLVLGVAPDLTAGDIPMTPVDQVAAAIVRQSRGTDSATIDLPPAYPVPLPAVRAEILRRGYRLDLVEPVHFAAALTEAAEQAATGDELLVRAAALTVNYSAEVGTAADTPAPVRPTAPCPGVDAETLSRYFDYYVEVGFLPPPAL